MVLKLNIFESKIQNLVKKWREICQDIQFFLTYYCFMRLEFDRYKYKHSNRTLITSTPYFIATPARVSILETRCWIWLDSREKPGGDDGDKDEDTGIVETPSISLGRATSPSNESSEKSWEFLLLPSASIIFDGANPLPLGQKTQSFPAKCRLPHIWSPNFIDFAGWCTIQTAKPPRNGEFYTTGSRVEGTSRSKRKPHLHR